MLFVKFYYGNIFSIIVQKFFRKARCSTVSFRDLIFYDKLSAEFTLAVADNFAVYVFREIALTFGAKLC